MKFLFSVICLFMTFGMCSAQNSSMFDICPLKVGSELPVVNVADKNARNQSLVDIVGDKPSVIVVYRGAWCGYCIQHLAELNDAKSDIEGLGYQIFGLTVDQPTKLEMSDEKAESEIPVYSDASSKAIQALGLDWQLAPEQYTKYKTEYGIDLETWSGQSHHALPVPAIFVVKEGIVQFQYVNPNYNTRLKAETLLAVLKTL